MEQAQRRERPLKAVQEPGGRQVEAQRQQPQDAARHRHARVVELLQRRFEAGDQVLWSQIQGRYMSGFREETHDS